MRSPVRGKSHHVDGHLGLRFLPLSLVPCDGPSLGSSVAIVRGAYSGFGFCCTTLILTGRRLGSGGCCITLILIRRGLGAGVGVRIRIVTCRGFGVGRWLHVRDRDPARFLRRICVVVHLAVAAEIVTLEMVRDPSLRDSVRRAGPRVQPAIQLHLAVGTGVRPPRACGGLSMGGSLLSCRRAYARACLRIDCFSPSHSTNQLWRRTRSNAC
jgi:hypothetical protein